jgi:phenylacetate-CoA ligase
LLLDGEAVTGQSPVQMVRKGLALTPEGREVFPDLTVAENLELGAAALKTGRREVVRRMQAVFDRFGRLAERRDQAAGTLSGGEQQMLAMGRALMAQPRLLLLDEPSLGLAPLITDEIFAIVHQLSRSGVTILLVEQNAARALSASHKAFLMAGGRIVQQGRSQDLLVDPRLRAAFLGAASKEKPEASRLGAAGLTNIRLEKPDMHQHTFMPDFPDHSALSAHQLKGLQWTVRHAFEGSSFYRQRLEAAGVEPESIHSLDDLKRLPFTTADDLREFYPFPLRSVPFEQIVRVSTPVQAPPANEKSSDTPRRTWTIGFTFLHAATKWPASPPWTASRSPWAMASGQPAWAFSWAAKRSAPWPSRWGRVISTCTSSSFRMCARRSFAARPPWPCFMAEEIHRRGIADKISIRKIIYGSERSSRSMRRKISELFGGAELFDITGLTELYGPGTGIECGDHDCIHYWGDYYILEIVDPETLQPVPDGEWGEMVVTTLRKEAAPLIRYRTRDITRIIPGDCTCGSVMPRHSRIKGRSDDTIKFRGVNIYPSTIDTILSAIPGLGSEYQIHLTRDEQSGKDFMKLKSSNGARPWRPAGRRN